MLQGRLHAVPELRVQGQCCRVLLSPQGRRDAEPDGEAVPACGLLYGCKFRYTRGQAEILLTTRHRGHGEQEQAAWFKRFSQLAVYHEGEQ